MDGGIIGKGMSKNISELRVEKCINKANISGRYGIGGIIGIGMNGNNTGKANIINCIYYGSITCKSEAARDLL